MSWGEHNYILAYLYLILYIKNIRSISWKMCQPRTSKMTATFENRIPLRGELQIFINWTLQEGCCCHDYNKWYIYRMNGSVVLEECQPTQLINYYIIMQSLSLYKYWWHLNFTTSKQYLCKEIHSSLSLYLNVQKKITMLA